MIKLSVITVTYKAEKTLERTLKSVRNQTYPCMEHVIVDGASCDGTVRLIREYEQENVVWVSEPDQGLYDAMNKAISMATGDYICFLNAGDTFFSSDTVEKMILSFMGVNPTKNPSPNNLSPEIPSSDNLSPENPSPNNFLSPEIPSPDNVSPEILPPKNLYPNNLYPDILYGETAIVDNDGNFLHNRRLKAPEKLTWKSFRQGMLVCHQAFIVKRDLSEPYDPSYRFSSDFDWCIRMMKKAKSIHNTRLTLINYLNEGLTTTHRKASLKERYRIMAKYYGHISTFFHHIWFVVRAVLK